MSSDKDRVFLTFQDSSWRKPCKWISEKVVNEFRRSCKDSDFVFLHFILTIRSGPTERGYIPLTLLVFRTLRLETKFFIIFISIATWHLLTLILNYQNLRLICFMMRQLIFFVRLMIKDRCVWGIPKTFSKWVSERGYRNHHGDFITYRFYKK